MINIEFVKSLVMLIVGKFTFIADMDLRDVTMLTGIGLVGYGFWLFMPALAFIITGIILLYISIWR